MKKPKVGWCLLTQADPVTKFRGTCKKPKPLEDHSNSPHSIHWAELHPCPSSTCHPESFFQVPAASSVFQSCQWRRWVLEPAPCNSWLQRHIGWFFQLKFMIGHMISNLPWKVFLQCTLQRSIDSKAPFKVILLYWSTICQDSLQNQTPLMAFD